MIKTTPLPHWDPTRVPPADARVFIGLWPTDETVHAIQSVAAQTINMPEARALLPQHWHITLAFIGAVMPEQWVHLYRGLTKKTVAVPATVPVDRFGFFEKASVLWLGIDPCSTAYEQLQQAHQDVWALLQGLGLFPDNRNYQPHISLLRQANKDVLNHVGPLSSFNWQTHSLRLIVSLANTQRSEYYQAATFPLDYLQWPEKQ